MEHFFLLLAAEEALLARLEMPLELVGPAHQCGYLGVDDTEISIKSKAIFSSLRGIFIATAQFRVIFIAKAKILPPPSVRAYLSVSGRSRGACPHVQTRNAMCETGGCCTRGTTPKPSLPSETTL